MEEQSFVQLSNFMSSFVLSRGGLMSGFGRWILHNIYQSNLHIVLFEISLGLQLLVVIMKVFYKKFWSPLTPMKVLAFSWRLVFDKLPTQDLQGAKSVFLGYLN